MKTTEFLGKLKKEKEIEPNADMNNMFVRYAMEEYAKAKLQKTEAQRDELLALAHSIVNGILAENEILHNAKKLIKSITNQ